MRTFSMIAAVVAFASTLGAAGAAMADSESYPAPANPGITYNVPASDANRWNGMGQGSEAYPTNVGNPGIIYHVPAGDTNRWNGLGHNGEGQFEGGAPARQVR